MILDFTKNVTGIYSFCVNKRLILPQDIRIESFCEDPLIAVENGWMNQCIGSVNSNFEVSVKHAELYIQQ